MHFYTVVLKGMPLIGSIDAKGEDGTDTPEGFFMLAVSGPVSKQETPTKLINSTTFLNTTKLFEFEVHLRI